MDIPVITGAPPGPFRTIDSVFGYFAVKPDSKGTFNLTAAFEGAKKSLRLNCKDLGGNAVIHCHFDFRIQGFEQEFQIFAYGTAVTLLS